MCIYIYILSICILVARGSKTHVTIENYYLKPEPLFSQVLLFQTQTGTMTKGVPRDVKVGSRSAKMVPGVVPNYQNGPPERSRITLGPVTLKVVQDDGSGVCPQSQNG